MMPETTTERAKKPAFRADGADLLTAVPVEWNESFKNLVRKDFTPDSAPVFWEWSADRMVEKADALRSQAAEFRASDGKSTKSKQTRYKELLNKIADLEAELSGGGVDLEALKASLAS